MLVIEVVGLYSTYQKYKRIGVPSSYQFGEKMLRLFEVFMGKNSSPIFSTLVRARASSPCTLLVGTIKPYNFYY